MKRAFPAYVASGIAALLIATGAAHAVRDPAPFKRPAAPAGVLRIWGPAAMQKIVALWAKDFHARHPDISVEAKLMGSDTAIPGLYSGQADIALMGRRDNVTDDFGFDRAIGYRFRRLVLMNGSLGTDGESPALAVLVDAKNPVAKLTLAQLASIAACPCAASGHAARKWGDLGADGIWAKRPVHMYLYDTTSGTGLFFQHVVFHGSQKLDWQYVTDFKDVTRPDGTVYTASRQIADALAHDPNGIAISPLTETTPHMKAVAIAAKDGGPFVLPTRRTVIAQTYPLARQAYAFVDAAPGYPLDPKVAAFLRFAFGPAGQSDVRKAGGYFPLSPATVRAQITALDEIIKGAPAR